MSSQKKMIQRIAGIMQVIIPLIGIFSAGIHLVYWGASENVIWFGPDNAHNLVIHDNPPMEGRRLVGIIATSPAVIVWLVALAHLFFLFRRFQQGHFIEPKVVSHLRGYTLFSVIAALLDIAGSGARRWAQGEFSDQPLWTHIQISPEHFLIVFSAAVFYFVSFVMGYAITYKDEAESYV
ncbi:MAG: hypothetical protein DHS20C05_21440 [Hyphococcus sp.]|nr:MAG: hypothetical protein DHS20C05_21440 [Marinicaulis sp.]